MHLTPADLAADLAAGIDTGTGAVSIERHGAATTDVLTTWLTRHTAAGGKVVLRPVLDLAHETAVDQHDPPPAMREQVVLRDSHCVKTHGTWTYKRLDDGSYTWTSPTGHPYAVTPVPRRTARPDPPSRRRT